ncbi:MAG: hypothetical protein QOF62_268 [Pyrinomonadaceae bacterium]|jgi:hypothetical protein|nr:hypothetical protein [Pyrinomonadaceae bacterium]
MKIACRTLNYIVAAAVLLAAANGASAQAARSTPEPPPRMSRPGEPPDPIVSMEEEMRAKSAIKYAQREYRENIDRAHELADLGSQLGASFKKNQQFDRADWKKLDRLEKLAKAIRNAAGGSNTETDSDKHPASLTVNVEELLTVVDSLAKRVEKTPRHVVSAAVIDEANVLLELIRFVRELSPKA